MMNGWTMSGWMWIWPVLVLLGLLILGYATTRVSGAAVNGAPIGRRRAIGLIGLGTVSVAAGITGWINRWGARGSNLLLPASGEPLRQPLIAASRDGVLDLRLTPSPGVRLAGRDTSAWGYNGTSPGPTVRVRPGDLLRIRLDNQLPQPTNLHTHGLRVSPQGNSDNPFIQIEPGGGFDYAIQIPPNHPAGTFWYHPHHHGTVADQLFAGLAGALIVEAAPTLPVTADQVLLVTDTTLDSDGRIVAASTADKAMGREGDLVLVNGQHRPVIAASPGDVQRWRVINGCVSRVLDLRLDGHTFTHIATDGMFLPAPADSNQMILAPGNRADLLVRPTVSGSFELVTDSYHRGSTMMMGGNGNTSKGKPVTIATLAVTGPAASAPPLPAALPALAVPQGPATRQRQLTFAMGMGGGMGSMRFTIDGRTFDPARDDQNVILGTTEDWTILNTSPMDHPFHLHAWPFHVLDTAPGTPPTATFQDVVLVPARTSIRLRIPFTDYPGRSVYHCHILDHEDQGMMGTINVHQ